MQPLGDYPCNVFVGWGDSTWFTEYDRAGEPVLDARLAAPEVLSYRAFQNAWRGVPADPPRLGVQRHRRGARLYASWNGSTEHRAWRVLGGAGAGALRTVGVAEAHGFETEIHLPHAPAHVAVEPLGEAGGAPLARSAVVRVRG